MRDLIFAFAVFWGGYMCRMAWEDFKGEEEEEE